jgi:hypothetical protein
MKLLDPELDKRLPVWIALAELFTDNDLSAGGKRHLAERLSQSSYTIEKIDVILCDEIFPTFSGNLQTVAGNWTGWSDEEVRLRVLKRLGRGVTGSMQWWRKWRVESLLGETWREVKQLVVQNHAATHRG